MAIPARTSVRTAFVGQPLQVVDFPVSAGVAVKTLVKQTRVFATRLWDRERTLWMELLNWLLVTIWSLALLVWGTASLPYSLAEMFDRGPYPWLSVAGILMCPIQLAAMISLNEKARAYVSVTNFMWIGGLAFSIIFGDYRVPTGCFYLAAWLLALVPYLKFRFGRPI